MLSLSFPDATSPFPHPLAQEGQETAPAAVPDPLAEGEPAPRGGGLDTFLVPMLLIFAIFYFVLILPERKKQKARQGLLSALKKGDRVMTTSGMYGTVAQIQDDVVTLQVAEGVRLRFSRQAIQTVLADDAKEAPKPTAPATSNGG